MQKFKTLGCLVKRNIKLFVRDKLTVFFSLLSSLIILMLFVLFLKDVQIDATNAFLAEYGAQVSAKYVNGLINGWFLSGVLAVSIISVGLAFYSVMVRDVELNIVHDFISSPTNKNLLKLSYFLASFIINVVINLIIMVIGIIYLLIAGTMFINFVDVLAIIANIILSSLSASLIMMLIASLFNKESQFGGFTGILSAVVGFIIGAYMPVSMFPMAIQYVVGFVPGSYSAGIFRNIFVGPVLNRMSSAGEAVTSGLSDYFGLNINFCGLNISYGMCYVFLAGSVLLFGLIAFLVFKYGKQRKKNVEQKKANKKKAV